MKNSLLCVIAALSLTACDTPADYFERIWVLNTKLMSEGVAALSASDAAVYDKALLNVDGVLSELDKCEPYSASDSVYFYLKKHALFASGFLHNQKENILSGGEKVSFVRRSYLDSASVYNKKVNAAAIAFMKEYDLNYNFDIADQ